MDRVPVGDCLVMPDIVDLSARVSILETKLDVVVKLTAAVAVPVYVQFLQMLARKIRGERRK